MKQTLLIVPPEIEDTTKPQPTQGTRVLFSDGSELAGVEHITLVAAVNDLWKATISTHFVCLPPTGIKAQCDVVPSQMLQDCIERIQQDFGPSYIEINLDGSVQIDGTLDLDQLEELCRRVRGLAK